MSKNKNGVSARDMARAESKLHSAFAGDNQNKTEENANVETREKVIEELEQQFIDRIDRYGEDLVNGLQKIGKYPDGVTVFGSARFDATSEYYQKAHQLGGLLATNGFTVVTGGGNGIMEAANRGAEEQGGQSLGLNIALPREQNLNSFTTDSQTFRYFFARKVMLAFGAQTFVYFPGGFGTLDEFSEILTLMQTHKIPKAPIILIGREYWEPLDAYFHDTYVEKFHSILDSDRGYYTITDNINDAVRAAVEHRRAQIASGLCGETETETCQVEK